MPRATLLQSMGIRAEWATSLFCTDGAHRLLRAYGAWGVRNTIDEKADAFPPVLVRDLSATPPHSVLFSAAGDGGGGGVAVVASPPANLCFLAELLSLSHSRTAQRGSLSFESLQPCVCSLVG
jgi:hypothetical protein